LVRDLPRGPGWTYEPKWDGFRALAFRDGKEVALQSRNERPLGRYFPEVVEALRGMGAERFVIDGELVVAERQGGFSSLLGRIHPAGSRVAHLARAHPATFVAFDA